MRILLLLILLTTSHAFAPSSARHAKRIPFLTATRVDEPLIADLNKAAWYPRRIQDMLDYNHNVKRLYIRHVVTETKEMAELAVKQYLELLSTSALDDPFAAVAASISACAATRNEGGKIGWVEKDISKNAVAAEYESIIPQDVVHQVFDKQPKAGDVYIIPQQSGLWHVVQTTEVWVDQFSKDAIKFDDNSVNKNGTTDAPVIGSHYGTNIATPRRKLPGQGVLPQLSHTSLTSYHVQTTGCQMNVADSERLMGVLKHDLKMIPAVTSQQADLLVINTCSIRDHAEQKLYDTLGPYAARKRKGENLAIVVTGCVAQQEGQALIQRVPEIDVVLGPQYIPYLGRILRDKVIEQGQQVVATAPMLIQDDNWQQEPVRGHDVRAWVNVMYGCNEHCTYCVVPGTRGMEQSRTMESILHECLDLYNKGYKEVTLVAQNIDAYARDMYPKRTFADLLQYLNANLPSSSNNDNDDDDTESFRIRYVTSHPRYFSDRVIDAVANLDKVCECFHVPFQAGDNNVLKAMRRGYTYESYMHIINKIKTAAPDAAICGDVIVGFPGETDEAFERTLDLMREVKFDNLNTFAYSPRPNTEAATWTEGLVPEDVKSERLQRVQALAAEHAAEQSRERYLNKVVQVLVEDANPKKPLTQIMGRTRQGRQVYFDGDLAKLKGTFVKVLVTEARTWSLMGEMV